MLNIILNKSVEIPLQTMTFSGGEEQIKLETRYLPETSVTSVDIHAFVQSSSELIQLALVVDALRRLERIDSKAEYTLFLPYIPYARQDRVMNPGEALSSVFLSNFINNLNFDRVYVEDPHSDVSSSGLKNVFVEKQANIVFRHLGWRIRKMDFILCSPDAGAAKKTEELAKKMGITEIIVGKKVRDVTTGQITGTVFMGNPVEGRNVLMVDDICDGGMTFIKLGEALKKAGAANVELFVTHGIFSKGADVFDGTVDKVFAHNVWEQNVTPDKNTKGIFQPCIKI